LVAARNRADAGCACVCLVRHLSPGSRVTGRPSANSRQASRALCASRQRIRARRCAEEYPPGIGCRKAPARASSTHCQLRLREAVWAGARPAQLSVAASKLQISADSSAASIRAAAARRRSCWPNHAAPCFAARSHCGDQQQLTGSVKLRRAGFAPMGDLRTMRWVDDSGAPDGNPRKFFFKAAHVCLRLHCHTDLEETRMLRLRPQATKATSAHAATTAAVSVVGPGDARRAPRSTALDRNHAEPEQPAALGGGTVVAANNPAPGMDALGGAGWSSRGPEMPVMQACDDQRGVLSAATGGLLNAMLGKGFSPERGRMAVVRKGRTGYSLASVCKKRAKSMGWVSIASSGQVQAGTY
jgi:hypothetical protein